MLTSVYFCFITLTTIGLGDVVAGSHPEFSQLARWVQKVCIVLYVIFGLSLLLALSTAIATRAHKTVKKTLMSDNSYYLDETTCSKKRRERSKSMVENEIALHNVQGLSSARTDILEPSDNQLPHLTKNMDEELAIVAAQEWTETQLLSGQTDTASPPPCYDIAVDSSMSSESSFIKTQNGRLSSHSTVAGMLTQSTCRERETRGESNGNISIITMRDCECANCDPVVGYGYGYGYGCPHLHHQCSAVHAGPLDKAPQSEDRLLSSYHQLTFLISPLPLLVLL